MKCLRYIEKNFEEAVMGVLLIGMALILMAQILMRVFAQNSLSWAEEVARYFYVWSVFLSISCTIRMRNILRVDFLLQIMPSSLKTCFEVLLSLANMILYGYLAYCSVTVVQNVQASAQTSPALKIPMYIIYAIVPVGFALASLRSIQKIYFDVKGINDVQPVKASESL
ncbi:MAG: TRAP transporter small permease [Synergistaceae bacterium]|nr:TRAP transporter small permease [Synergistaceae bacterium]